MKLAEFCSWAEAGNPHMMNSSSRRYEKDKVIQPGNSGRTAASLLLLGSFLALTASYSAAQSISGKPRVYPAIHHDISAPLKDIQARATTSVLKEAEAKEEERQKQELEEMGHGGNQSIVATLPSKPPERSRRLFQQLPGNRLQALPGLNFDGIPSNGWLAPDTNGSAGATQYVQYVNNRFAVYDKSSGNLLHGPLLETALWSGFGGLCSTDAEGDIIAEYDKAAGRWVMTHRVSHSGGPDFQCVAVSTTSDATGSYYRYAFQLPSNDFPDYPKLSVWPDAYYLSVNDENPNTGSFIHAALCALDRNSMLNGASAATVCFSLNSSVYSSLLPADLDGNTPPPAGSPNYFLNLDKNSVDLWQFHVDFVNPSNSTFTGPVNIPVASYNPACGGGTFAVCIPQAGTAQVVDSLGDRLMWRLAYRNFGDHETLVATHSVATGSGNVGVRWYEIRNPGGTPTVYQQGTFAPDSNFRWMGSITMDQMGDIALGYSESSSSMDPAIYYTGRLATDPLGTMENETLMMAGSAVEQGTYRWGDYTGMSIDPVDDCTFWYTNEYFAVNGKGNWHTRIASFKFPACPGVTTSPDSLSFGAQQVGTSSPSQSITLINNQTTTVNISNIGFTGANSGDFGETNNCGNSLAPGTNCAINVTFTPSATGTRQAALNVTDNANNSPQIVNVTGIGVVTAVTLSPGQLTFPNQPVGFASAPLAVVVRNSSASSVTISGVSASGNYGETDNCSGNTLQPSQSCVVSVVLTPALVGSIPGALTVSDNATGSPQVLGLSGSGVKPLALSPANMAFGTLAVGSSSLPQTATLTNNAATPVNFSFSASGDYSASGSGNKPCQATLARNAKCTIAVTFSPSANGASNGSLTVAYGAALSPQVVSLTGTGSGGSTAPLIFSPESLGFGNVVVGTTSPNRVVTVTNQGTTSVNISEVQAGGNFSAFPSGATPCGGSLAAGKSCKFSVNFNPTILGPVKSGVMVADNSTISPQLLDLVGTGVLPITLSPPSLTFSAQSVGTTSPPQIVTLTSNQSSALSLSFTASGDYVIQPGGGNPCGTSLPALGQCTVSVAFSPSATGTIPGVASFTHSGIFSPQEVALTGTGQ
jgi:hypothetical protein